MRLGHGNCPSMNVNLSVVIIYLLLRYQVTCALWISTKHASDVFFDTSRTGYLKDNLFDRSNASHKGVEILAMFQSYENMPDLLHVSAPTENCTIAVVVRLNNLKQCSL